jgi:hypothetical protein
MSVEPVHEQWVVEDRWWTAAPLRRRCFELVPADCRSAVVFRDPGGGRGFTRRA